MRETTSKCHLCQTRLQLRPWPALREAHIKNQLCWLKRIPHPLDGHHGDLTVMVFPHPPILSIQTSAQTNTTKWDMIDHCTATIISSVSMIPFSDHVIKYGSNRSLKTCQNRFGSRGHAFTYSQMHPIVYFGVFTSYHKSKNLCRWFLSFKILQHKQTDSSFLE